MKKITRLLLCALCAVSLFGSESAMTGCGGSDAQVLTVTGSTSVQPLMIKLAAAYEAKHSDVEINVGAGGSSVGVSDAKEGKSAFGMASRELKDAEVRDGMVSVKIAVDGLALIVNKNCPVESVTKEEVCALYKDGTPVQDTIRGALSREGGSGTRDAFEELIGIEGALYKGEGFTDGINSTSGVITDIKGNTAGNVMGYISLGSLSSDVKALRYGGIEASAANVKSGAYTLSRPFHIVYKKDALSKAAQDFIDFIMSAEGQAIVAENKYIAVG